VETAAIRTIAYMVHLRASDFGTALELLGTVNDAAGDVSSFARIGVERLPALVASEFTTLSVCDLVHGGREVYGLAAGTLGVNGRAAFDRHFTDHPLVRFHGYQGGTGTWRISDSIAFERFRRTALYNEYYRRIGVDHAIALPVFVGGGRLVSFVLNRSRRDFSERERALLEMLRPALAKTYARIRLLGSLSARESEVLHWVAAGKSDAQVAEILRLSRRTVQKHLQHIYEKLGVETRTAAVLRLVRG
jgi:DNA-binding CsgD family transcriptional regulator